MLFSFRRLLIILNVARRFIRKVSSDVARRAKPVVVLQARNVRLVGVIFGKRLAEQALI